MITQPGKFVGDTHMHSHAWTQTKGFAYFSQPTIKGIHSFSIKKATGTCALDGIITKLMTLHG